MVYLVGMEWVVDGLLYSECWDVALIHREVEMFKEKHCKQEQDATVWYTIEPTRDEPLIHGLAALEAEIAKVKAKW